MSNPPRLTYDELVELNHRMATRLANNARTFQESLEPVLRDTQAKAWAEGKQAAAGAPNPYADIEPGGN